MNKTILIIIIILVVIIGGYFLFRGSYQEPAPTSSPTPAPSAVPENVEEKKSGTTSEKGTSPSSEIKEFTVLGDEYNFNPSSITVKAGDRVKITFKNVGEYRHDFVIDGLGVRTKIIESGQTDAVEFTALTSETYSFICSIPGHKEAGMEGQLEVE